MVICVRKMDLLDALNAHTIRNSPHTITISQADPSWLTRRTRRKQCLTAGMAITVFPSTHMIDTLLHSLRHGVDTDIK